jgi:hypothetical protein
MRKHVKDPIGLEIERPATIRDNLIFVLVRLYRDAIKRLFKQIDGRRSVKRKEILANRGGKSGIGIVENKDGVDCFGAQLWRDGPEPLQ